jgi:NagD protein
MESLASAHHWLCDMDGVLINHGHIVDGADKFLDRLREKERGFLVLTNNALFTPDEIHDNLQTLGVHVERDQLWTSSLATAQFVHDQRPKGRAFVIGEAAIHDALSDVGYIEDAANPDYVVIGETWTYSFEEITTAIRLVDRGIAFVATNPETFGTTPEGLLPGSGALTALIQSVTNVRPYFVGKPNPVMIRDALNILGAHSKSTVMVGDRMDTDIRAGVEAGVETVLVLSGVAQRDEISRYAFQPSHIVDSIADLIDQL